MDPIEFNYLLSEIKTNRKALEKIYDVFFPRILIHIKRKYPSVTAEDVAQEFFMGLLRYEKFRFIKNPTWWVFVSCDNIVKNMNRIEVCAELAELENDASSTDTNSLDKVFIDDQVREVFDSLADELTKKIVYLYYWEGYSLREIADMLSLKRSTVKQKHTRAINKLKQDFKL